MAVWAGIPTGAWEPAMVIGSAAFASHSPGLPPHGPGAHGARGSEQAVIEAQRALAAATARVEADKRAHSPDCVACDQKLVDKAQQQVAALKASRAPTVGDTLDITL